MLCSAYCYEWVLSAAQGRYIRSSFAGGKRIRHELLRTTTKVMSITSFSRKKTHFAAVHPGPSTCRNNFTGHFFALLSSFCPCWARPDEKFIAGTPPKRKARFCSPHLSLRTQGRCFLEMVYCDRLQDKHGGGWVHAIVHQCVVERHPLVCEHFNNLLSNNTAQKRSYIVQLWSSKTAPNILDGDFVSTKESKNSLPKHVHFMYCVFGNSRRIKAQFGEQSFHVMLQCGNITLYLLILPAREPTCFCPEPVRWPCQLHTLCGNTYLSTARSRK